jgi:hypothetical protein
MGSVHSDSGYDSASTRGDRDSFAPGPQPSIDIASMSLVKIVTGLFKIPEGAIQLEVDKIRGTIVTEKVWLHLHPFTEMSLMEIRRLRLQTSRCVYRYPPSPDI